MNAEVRRKLRPHCVQLQSQQVVITLKKIKASICPTYIWHVLYRERANYTHHKCRHVEEVQYEMKGMGSLLLICYWRSWECVRVCVYQL